MNSNLIIERLTNLLKLQNPKSRFKIKTDILNSKEIQIDIIRNNSFIEINNVTKLLYGTGFNRLFITVSNNVELKIYSDNYSYVVRTGLNCNIKSIYRSNRIPIYMELGEKCHLIYGGPHDIKNNKNCKIIHISKVTNEQN